MVLMNKLFFKQQLVLFYAPMMLHFPIPHFFLHFLFPLFVILIFPFFVLFLLKLMKFLRIKEIQPLEFRESEFLYQTFLLDWDLVNTRFFIWKIHQFIFSKFACDCKFHQNGDKFVFLNYKNTHQMKQIYRWNRILFH